MERLVINVDSLLACCRVCVASLRRQYDQVVSRRTGDWLYSRLEFGLFEGIIFQISQQASEQFCDRIDDAERKYAE